MSFKQFIFESGISNYNDITFKIVGNKAYMDDRGGGIVNEKPNEYTSAVFCLKDSKNGTWWVKEILPWQRFAETPKDQNWRIIQQPSWYKREKGGYKRGVERNDFRRKIERELVPKLIKHYELTQGLKGSAKDTWEDILS